MSTNEHRHDRKPDGAASAGTVHRVVQLLRCLIEADGPVGVTYIHTRLQLPVATVHRLLGLLVEVGMVEGKLKDRQYRPGSELVRLANLLQTQEYADRAVIESLGIVARESGGVAMFCRYLTIEGAMTYANKVYTGHSKHVGPNLLRPGPIAWGASGHAVLAWLSKVEQDALIFNAGPSPVKGKPVDSEDLRRTLGTVRKSGYAISYGDKLPKEVGIAAPVFGCAGSVVGSLCVTKPQRYFDRNTEPRIADIVREHALSLSKEFRLASRR